MTTRTIQFSRWFDPEIPDHMAAFVRLSEAGTFPEGFVPSNVVMDVDWYTKITNTMVKCWVEHYKSQTNKTMPFIDWFDPYNVDHMAAFDIWRKKGRWPSTFIPEHVKLNVGWSIQIYKKIATALYVVLTSQEHLTFSDWHGGLK